MTSCYDLNYVALLGVVALWGLWEFKASLVYVVSPRPVSSTTEKGYVSKNKQTKIIWLLFRCCNEKDFFFFFKF